MKKVQVKNIALTFLFFTQMVQASKLGCVQLDVYQKHGLIGCIWFCVSVALKIISSVGECRLYQRLPLTREEP